MTSDELLTKADKDPRVIEARDRYKRGELSRARLHQIRHAVAGLCEFCRLVATVGRRCDVHTGKPVRKSKPRTDAQRAAQSVRERRKYREARGLPPDAVLPRGSKGVKKQCKKCLERGHFAKTCGRKA